MMWWEPKHFSPRLRLPPLASGKVKNRAGFYVRGDASPIIIISGCPFYPRSETLNIHRSAAPETKRTGLDFDVGGGASPASEEKGRAEEHQLPSPLLMTKRIIAAKTSTYGLPHLISSNSSPKCMGDGVDNTLHIVDKCLYMWMPTKGPEPPREGPRPSFRQAAHRLHDPRCNAKGGGPDPPSSASRSALVGR